jgi:hypothetical protein
MLGDEEDEEMMHSSVYREDKIGVKEGRKRNIPELKQALISALGA